MSKLIGQSRRVEPHIDLETIRETLAYIHSDTLTSARLAKVNEALRVALDELAALDAKPQLDQQRQGNPVVAFPSSWPRFVPWSAK